MIALLDSSRNTAKQDQIVDSIMSSSSCSSRFAVIRAVHGKDGLLSKWDENFRNHIVNKLCKITSCAGDWKGRTELEINDILEKLPSYPPEQKANLILLIKSAIASAESKHIITILSLPKKGGSLLDKKIFIPIYDLIHSRLFSLHNSRLTPLVDIDNLYRRLNDSNEAPALCEFVKRIHKELIDEPANSFQKYVVDLVLREKRTTKQSLESVAENSKSLGEYYLKEFEALPASILRYSS